MKTTSEKHKKKANEAGAIGLSPQVVSLTPEDQATMSSRSSSENCSPLIHRSLVKEPGNEKIRYFFEGRENSLMCTLQFADSSQLTNQFITSMIAIIQVLNLSTYCQPFINIDLLAGVFKIGLREVNDSRAFQVIVDFIHRLAEMGINELHENKHALWFYTNNGGDEILNVHNYPSTLQTFLTQEAAAVNSFLGKHKSKYTTFVEVGCGHMVNLPLASNHQLNYLGLDFSPVAIRSAQADIQRNGEKYTNVRVECFNILNLHRIKELLQQDEVPIFFLPFNLFGNIAPVILFITRLREQNFDVVISIYKTDAKTNTMRRTYYENCGYKAINLFQDVTGNTFYSEEGLYTVAYDPEYLVKLFKQVGFQVTLTNAGNYGYLLSASPIPLSVPTFQISPVVPAAKREIPSQLSLPPHGIAEVHDSVFMLKISALSSAVCVAALLLSHYTKNAPMQKRLADISTTTAAATTLASLAGLLYKQGFWKNPSKPVTPALSFGLLKQQNH